MEPLSDEVCYSISIWKKKEAIHFQEGEALSKEIYTLGKPHPN
jgi:hypothetical protein